MPQMSVCRLLATSGRLAALGTRGAAPLRPLATSAPALADAVTHTGQQWEENVSEGVPRWGQSTHLCAPQDLRSVRFDVTGVTKEVNPQWAVDLIAEVPVKMVSTRVVSGQPSPPPSSTPVSPSPRQVACDGGGTASTGHPRVFINLDHGKPVACIYCGLRFQLEH